jgi:hypothetical protein
MILLFIITVIGLIFQPQLAKAEKHGLSLETDKNVYALGENITIILTNNGNETVEIGGYPAWEILNHPEGEHVCPVIYASLLWKLDPGEDNSFVWNQYNWLNLTFVEPGTYVAKDTQGWELHASFEIVATENVAPEFPSAIILSLFMMFSMLIAILAQKYEGNISFQKSL